MTTYSLQGFSFTENAVGTITSFITGEGLDIVVNDGQGIFVYETNPPVAPPGTIPEVNIEISGLVNARLNGINVIDTGLEATLGGVQWNDSGVPRETFILQLEDPFTNLKTIFEIGGDPFPDFASATGLNNFIFSQLTGSGPITSGPFAPGEDIPLADFQDVGITENDSIIGTPGVDSLEGGSGSDQIVGLAGNDTLNGGAGTDNDTLDGGLGTDIADYSDATSDTTVILFNRDGIAQSTVSSGRDTLIDIENITGSDFNDKLIGDAGGNIIRGGIGNDTIDGVGGGDLLRGDAGNDGFRARGGVDDFNGGADVDFVNYDASTGVNAFLDGSGTNGRAAVGDTFVGIENLVGSDIGGDLLYGDAGANRLTGLGGADTLRGRAGIDQLEGGDGADTLIGDEGADVYITGIGSDTVVFNLAPDAANRDRITDFTSGQDTLQIDASVFGGGLVAGGAVQLVANTNPTAAGPGGTFLYDTDSGLLRFDADGTGAGNAELFAWLQNVPVLLASDFDVVA